MRKSLAGTRIRESRRQSGMTQKALAEAAGISASYLNLIEHNRRAVAGRVLLALARSLDVPAASLADGVESAIIGDLFEAAAHGGETSAETDAVEEMISRFPGWARLLTTLYRQSRDQETAIAALSDRLTHDPFLAESLHGMLSNITAIRSTSNILTSIDDIEPAQQSRFHAIIHEESRRLTDAAQALVTYFDHATDRDSGVATPEEALDLFLATYQYAFAELEDGQTSIDQILRGETNLKDSDTNNLARQYLDQYLKDAQRMPIDTFTKIALNCGFDPGQIAQAFDVDLPSVFRRLSSLKRDGIDCPPMGLVVVNAAGHAVFRRPLPEFALPRHGSACARWPLFQAFSQPDRRIAKLLELPNGQQFIGLAYAQSVNPGTFGETPEYQSSMLIIAVEHVADIQAWLPPTGPAQEIGVTCRICPRDSCPTRAEPQILAKAVTNS